MMSHRRQPASTRTIPFPGAQPVPLSTYVTHVGGTTAIVRVWSEGDAAHCRLCPRGKCGYDADDALCLVHVARHVPRPLASLAPLFGPTAAPASTGLDGTG